MKTIEGFKPYYFQEKSILSGIEMLEKHNSLFLMDETGLGKTITASHIVFNQMNGGRLLVVSPNSNKRAWEEILSLTDIDFTISGNRAIPHYTEKFTHIIIDEVHKIGGINSKTFMALFKLIRANHSKLVLITATPYNNQIESFGDLLCLFNFPRGGYLRYVLDITLAQIYTVSEKLEVLNRYPIHYTSKQGKEKMNMEFLFVSFMEELSKALGLFSIRNTRANIEIKEGEELLMKFPTVVKNSLELEHNDDEIKAYSDIATKIEKMRFAWQNQLTYYNKSEGRGTFGAVYRITLYKRLESSTVAFKNTLQSTYNNIMGALDSGFVDIAGEKVNLTQNFEDDLCHDAKIIAELMQLATGINDDVKTNALFDIIENAEGKKVVFTEYIDTLNTLIDEAKKRGIKFISYQSGDKENVLDVINDEFDANNHVSDKYDVLFCTDVLAEGVNLHYAKSLIHFDSKWNPSKITQREGRINRICHNNPPSINVYSFDVPYFVDNVITLDEKTERKNNEAEMLLKHINEAKMKLSDISGYKVITNPVVKKSYVSKMAFHTNEGVLIFEGGNTWLSIRHDITEFRLRQNKGVCVILQNKNNVEGEHIEKSESPLEVVKGSHAHIWNLLWERLLPHKGKRMDANQVVRLKAHLSSDDFCEVFEINKKTDGIKDYSLFHSAFGELSLSYPLIKLLEQEWKAIVGKAYKEKYKTTMEQNIKPFIGEKCERLIHYVHYIDDGGEDDGGMTLTVIEELNWIMNNGIRK